YLPPSPIADVSQRPVLDVTIAGLETTSSTEISVHTARRLPAFPLRPHHERLPPAAIARCEDPGLARGESARIGAHVAAWIELHTKVLDQSLVHGVAEPHCEQHERRRNRELTARDHTHRVHQRSIESITIEFDPHTVQPLDPTRLPGELGRHHRVVARTTLLVRARH